MPGGGRGEEEEEEQGQTSKQQLQQQQKQQQQKQDQRQPRELSASFVATSLATLDTRLAALLNSNKTAQQQEPARRMLYRDLELFRLDYTEQPQRVKPCLYALSHERDTAKHAAIRAELDADGVIAATMVRLDALRYALRRTPQHSSKLCQVFNLACALAVTLASIPLILLFMPLRLTHPLLRRCCGVRNGRLPVDMVQKYYARAFLAATRVRVKFIGLPQSSGKDDDDGNDSSAPCLGMFSHASNLDSFVVSAGPLAFKWIGKKSLFKIPIIGWIMRAWYAPCRVSFGMMFCLCASSVFRVAVCSRLTCMLIIIIIIIIIVLLLLLQGPRCH
jgi:hypothetical protein